MHHIFIDLEFCTCFRKSSPLRTETIEIGAVKLDDDYRLIGEFDRLVRPDFARSIPSAERNLTGINWSMVENERSFTDVFYDFVNWIGDGEYLIYSWSANDPIQCFRESRVKGFPIAEIGMMKRWIDFQKVFMNAAGLKNQISLERAVELCDLYFSGDAHRACVDAYNTARLFRFCQAFDSIDMDVFFLAGIEDGLTPGRTPGKGGGRRRGRSGGRNGAAAVMPRKKQSEHPEVSEDVPAADGNSSNDASKTASRRRSRRSSSRKNRTVRVTGSEQKKKPGHETGPKQETKPGPVSSSGQGAKPPAGPAGQPATQDTPAAKSGAKRKPRKKTPHETETHSERASATQQGASISLQEVRAPVKKTPRKKTGDKSKKTQASDEKGSET
ncbi:MAG: hypothetical protein IKX06_02910 [Clostridia bacterium]|nr:hypothetical protein [Clostridia bacterium]